MKLFGRGSLYSLQNVIKLFKPKWDAAKVGSGADDLKLKDVVKDLFDNFYAKLKDYNKIKDNV